MKYYKMMVVNFLVCVLLLGTPMNILASIEEPNGSAKMIQNADMKELLVSKSVEAFPEFEEKIRGENVDEINSALMRRSGIGEVVYTETRMLSENEMVTYMEYDSGVAATAVGLMAGKKELSSNWEGNVGTYVMNVWLQYGGSESILFVKNFKYEIYTYGYDKITYIGDYRTDMTTALAASVIEEKKDEDSSDVAKVKYGGGFVFYIYTGGVLLPYSFYATLIVDVGNNTCTISAQ